MTFKFRGCGDGVYQLTQRERALEVHTLEDERLSLSSPQSLQGLDSSESRMFRPSVPFRHVIRHPNPPIVASSCFSLSLHSSRGFPQLILT